MGLIGDAFAQTASRPAEYGPDRARIDRIAEQSVDVSCAAMSQTWPWWRPC